MKILIVLLFIFLFMTGIFIMHKQTSGGKKVQSTQGEVPLLTTLEEIKEFKPVVTIQYAEPIGPVKELH